MMSPVIDEVANDMEGKAAVYKLDVDEPLAFGLHLFITGASFA